MGEETVRSNCKTPSYNSPEQARFESISQKTDLWSWGLTVLEMFTGGVTWLDGQVALQALDAHLEENSKIAETARMPAALASLLRRCFQLDPNQRPENMDEVANVLLKIRDEMAAGELLHQLIEDLRAKNEKDSSAWPEIPGYEITKSLGVGAGGRSFEAHDLKRSRDVYIAVAPSEASTRTLKAFVKSGGYTLQILKAIDHPNVASCLDSGVIEDDEYVVMRKSSGKSLDQILKERGGVLPVYEACNIMLGVLDGLAYLHEKGIAHLEIGPIWISLRGDGQTCRPMIMVGSGAIWIKDIYRLRTFDDDLLQGGSIFSPREWLTGRPSLSSDVFSA